VRAQVEAGTWRYTYRELEFSPSRFLADPDGTNASMKEVLYG
jgi:urea carboxylase